ncbi:MAG: DEAD/DEAH box helicase, partial [Magnetococcales bacterium]|nr:DEAD/DEAH box helicase [Magnetococcales bacterium]
MADTAVMSETNQLIQALFGPQSLFASTVPHYESRSAQVRMAQLVAEVAVSDGCLLVEAATGTGKTLAYLLPLLAMGHRVIVATATKALQDQIVAKDLPLVRQIMRSPFSFASLKGRSNYLCLLRFRAYSHGATISQEKKWLKLIKEWLPY